MRSDSPLLTYCKVRYCRFNSHCSQRVLNFASEQEAIKKLLLRKLVERSREGYKTAKRQSKKMTKDMSERRVREGWKEVSKDKGGLKDVR